MIECLAVWSSVRDTIGSMVTHMSPAGILGREDATMWQLSALLAERVPGPVLFDPLQFRIPAALAGGPVTVRTSTFSAAVEWKILPTTLQEVEEVERGAKEILSDPKWRSLDKGHERRDR